MTHDDEEDDDDDEYDDYEDEESDPLEDGVDSVQWLPSLKSYSTSTSDITSSSSSGSSDSNENSEILPFFPLGGIVYTPNSEHVLNIFEPRYRKMYTDILMNGSKRFVVSMSHPSKEGVFAQTGVIFYLEDLKEVSELTDDKVKYICNHKVTKRIKLHKVLNPEAWENKETYLKIEGTILDDDDDDDEDDGSDSDSSKEAKDEEVSDNDIYKTLAAKASSGSKVKKSKEEEQLVSSFTELVNKQHEAGEDVRFTIGSIQTLALKPGGGDDGLWQTIRLWQSFIDQRLIARQNEMQMEFQTKLIEFLKKEKGFDENKLPSTIGYNDLSPDLQQEVQALQKRMSSELQPLVLESTLTIQIILEANDHVERLNLLKYFMDAEKKRLDAKSTLQGMFAGSAKAITDEPEISAISSDSDSSAASSASVSSGKSSSKSIKDAGASSSVKKDDKQSSNKTENDTSSSSQGASFFDDEDAFQ